MTHSIISPSSSSCWSVCTAQPMLALQYPNLGEETEAEREGVATHQLGADFIYCASRALPYPSKNDVIGKAAQNGVIFDEDMYAGAEMYADYVGSIMRKRGNFVPNVEETLAATSIHVMSFGTCDNYMVTQAVKIIDCFDFKYGFDPVEVFENSQLINYVAGIMDTLRLSGFDDQQWFVVFHIVQPRAHHRDGPVRTWSVRLSTLRAYFNKLRAAAEEVFSPNAKYVTGNHCIYCPVRHVCSTLQKAAQASMQFISQSTAVELSPDAIGTELALIERAETLLKARKTGLESQAESLLRSGKRVAHYMLVNSYGRLTWKTPANEVIVMGNLLGIDLDKKEAVTPLQAVKKGMDQKLVDSMSEKPLKGLKLAADDGTRARFIFTQEKSPNE